MKVGIYYNKNYLKDNLKHVDKITARLNSNGITCSTINNVNELAGIEVLIVLGGDGTILKFASECAKLGIKIMGINYGHIGFLAEFEQEKLDNAIDLICSQKYKTEKRSLIEVNIGGKQFLALNDLVFQRSTYGNKYSNTIDITAEIDGSLVDNYFADGVIVSTPTGSTAYSLAAGGSILTPDLKAFILTPLCAHSLHSRPIVFGDDSTLKLLFKKENTSVNVSVDGNVIGEYENYAEAVIKKSVYTLEFITTGEINFFDKLLSKLSKWSR